MSWDIWWGIFILVVIFLPIYPEPFFRDEPTNGGKPVKRR